MTTLFGADALNSINAFVAALLIGVAFGAALEQAGFGSSRRLAGVFYFRDMTVLKVMFTAVITAMLGLSYVVGLGLLPAEQLFFLPTVYGAQIVGGLLFGVGFVMSGWCPGTAAVGLASGKLDALVFLVGAAGGSILFNETYAWSAPLAALGDRGVQFAWANLGLSQPAFAVLFTVIAVVAFWGAEYIERRRAATQLAGAGLGTGGAASANAMPGLNRNAPGGYLNTPFLRAFSVALLVLAAPLLFLGGGPSATSLAFEAAAMPAADAAPPGKVALPADTAPPPARGVATLPDTGMSEHAMLLAAVAEGADHVEPEQLADRLLAGGTDLLLIDVRAPEEYARFHIRNAINVALPDLPAHLAAEQRNRDVVLYSNGMTHPAQARDALTRAGFANVYILTDGLGGFIERCLKPLALRTTPDSEELAQKIRAWRAYFSEPWRAGDGLAGSWGGEISAN